MTETPEQAANWAATLAVRQVLAQAKNPSTTLGKMKPTSVAYHAAIAAVEAHRKVLEGAGYAYGKPGIRL